VIHYDHALLGATLAVAAGVRRRYGWPLVAVAAVATMVPDWDSLSRSYGAAVHRSVHRVWGHNLPAAALGGAAVGALGLLCVRSVRVGRGRPAASTAPEWPVWVGLGALAGLVHSLADVIYSAERGAPDWPVALLWPASRQAWAIPLVTCEDRGSTVILVTGLLACVCRPSHSRLLSCVTLLTLAAYVLVRAATGDPGT
jgi:membrane-bound metal-dependent hydrolase YbcI (DUF457 family)